LIPSLFAALVSGIEEGSGNSAASYTATLYNATNSTFNSTTINYPAYIGPGRTSTSQGVFQLVGWAISVGLGAASGAIIGLIYRLLNDSFEEINQLFNDATLFDFPKAKIPAAEKKLKTKEKYEDGESKA
jgi:hypothetical protein